MLVQYMKKPKADDDDDDDGKHYTAWNTYISTVLKKNV